MSDGPSPAELAGYVRVARDHREHERYHSVLKLEESAAWRRDSNALKLLAARWSDSPEPDRLDPAHGAVGCVDLNDPAVVATTGILFMEGDSEPAELTSLRSRFEQAAVRYQRLSGWLGEHMAAEWPRLRSLLVPDLVEAARPRFRALTRTTEAANAYSLVARLLDSAVHTLKAQDLTPEGVRRDPAAAAKMVLTASWFLDSAASALAEAGARLGLSDPDWTSFIALAEA
ncbi:hypothetical protein ACWEHA_13510 [Amycolatopsis nivea]